MSDLVLFLLHDPAEQQTQPQELSFIEHFTKAAVAPAVEPPGFVPRRYLIIRDGEGRGDLIEILPRPLQSAKVGRLGSLEKSPLVDRLTLLAMIFDGPHPVRRRTQRFFGRVGECGPAFPARCLVSPCDALDKDGAAAFPTGFRIRRCGLASVLVKLPAHPARHDMARMANSLGKQITGEKIVLGLATGTRLGLYPDEVLDGCRFATPVAPRCIKFPDFFLNVPDDGLGGFGKGIEIKRGQRLPNDPEGHWVDVRSHDVKSKTVGLVDRRAAPHEGIGDDSFEIVCPPIGRFERLLTIEFGHKQGPENGPRAASKPFMDADDGTVILLDLLLALRQNRCERGVEIGFQTGPIAH